MRLPLCALARTHAIIWLCGRRPDTSLCRVLSLPNAVFIAPRPADDTGSS
jgi:hypothetical protein